MSWPSAAGKRCTNNDRIYTIKSASAQLWGAPTAPSLHRLPPFLKFWDLLNIP